jgi:hypothetical protein
VVNRVNVGEPAVTVSSTPARENETNFVFDLHLDAPSPSTVSVAFATVPGTALAGQDYETTNGVVTFAPGATNAKAWVRLIDDHIFETESNRPPEYFQLQLTAATNASILDAYTRADILEDDPLPTLSVSPAAFPEGNAGTNYFPVTIKISGPAAMPIEVSYITRSGTGFDLDRGFILYGTAEDGDFAFNQSAFIFNPGETQRVVNVGVVGDTVAEPDETFTLLITSPILLPVYPTRPRPYYALLHPITIVDDDSPALVVDDYRVIAGNCGTNNNAVDPGETVTVELQVRNAGYNACASSNLTATLQAGDGILSPSGPQNYGPLCATMDAWRPFTFTVGASCGSNIKATLTFADNGTNLGMSSLTIPVGRRAAILAETFDATPLGALPTGWTTSPYPDSPWYATNDITAPTNHYAYLDWAHPSEGAIRLASPPFVTQSSNATVKVRHRFQVSPATGFTTLRVNVNGGYYTTLMDWIGSSQGWMTSVLSLPPELMGATQQLAFELVQNDGPLPASWSIDRVEVFDGAADCCNGSGGAPRLALRRQDGEVTLEWNSIANRSYQLQFRPSLTAGQAWSKLGSSITSTGPVTTVTVPIAGESGYYQVLQEE